jgi:hypothetical protein
MGCECFYCSVIYSGGYISGSRTDWPFPLIVSTGPEKRYRYTPRSYFHVFVNHLLCLLVEVQSDKCQRDRSRMLLQAACAARLGCASYGHPFVVAALYIEKCGRVTRYFVFQHDPDDLKVNAFESKPSSVFSVGLLGFLCLRRPRLDATIQVVCGHIRNVQPRIDDTK